MFHIIGCDKCGAILAQIRNWEMLPSKKKIEFDAACWHEHNHKNKLDTPSE